MLRSYPEGLYVRVCMVYAKKQELDYHTMPYHTHARSVKALHWFSTEGNQCM